MIKCVDCGKELIFPQNYCKDCLFKYFNKIVKNELTREWQKEKRFEKISKLH